MFLFWSSVAASLAAVVGCGYLIAAAVLVGRFARDAAPTRPLLTPGVSVLKPLHGAEPGLVDNLASFCVQDYPGPVQIVLGVQDANDAAVAVVEQLLVLSAQELAGAKQRGREGGAVLWHGAQRGVIAMAERQLRVQKPRLRDKNGHEVDVPAYERLP